MQTPEKVANCSKDSNFETVSKTVERIRNNVEIFRRNTVLIVGTTYYRKKVLCSQGVSGGKNDPLPA